MTEYDSPPGVIDQIREAIDFHCKGRREDAETMLGSIDKTALEREYDEGGKRILVESRPPKTIDEGVRAKRSVSIEDEVRMFRRDKFVCRYCGRRTIFVPTLRALSLLYPGALPYQGHWEREACHRVYWIFSTVCGYVAPISRGGTPDMDNLVTTCGTCTFRKKNWRPEEIGWEVQPVPPTTLYWDGLSTQFVRLWTASPAIHREGDLQQWYDAIFKS